MSDCSWLLRAQVTRGFIGSHAAKEGHGNAFAGLGSSRHYHGIGVALGIGGFSGVAPGR